jgi:DNA invertase Pin-like site-specific DNA recombinase
MPAPRCQPAHNVGARQVSPELVAKVRALHAQGNSTRLTCRLLGIGDEVLYRILDLGQARQDVIDKIALRLAEAPA